MTTLPRRHTSATSARSSSNRCSAGSASLAAFFVACWQPSWVFYCMSASNFALLVNMVAVWSRLKDDFVDPLQKRAEERHQRWAAFLEKSRLDAPTSEPPDAER